MSSVGYALDNYLLAGSCTIYLHLGQMLYDVLMI